MPVKNVAREDFIISQARVVPLVAGKNIDSVAVGPKAMSLVSMERIGLPVPPAFCVLSICFNQHLEEYGLISRIKSMACELEIASPEDKNSLLSDIRQAIIKAPLADVLRQEIEQHYLALGANCVAVRSSALMEDLPKHSFAGQHGTYFVSDLKACLRAVKDCWASSWTDRAYDYRRRNGFDHLSLSMAVIIQELIEADASGVLFTADPVTGCADRLVIEACFGLGEALVSGKVTPDRFVVAKEDLRVLEREVSSKPIEVILDEVGRVQEQAIPPERRNQCCIDESVLRRLSNFALKAEHAFGSPQDIEWTVDDGKIFLVQSRPITTIEKKETFADRQVWSNVNTGEILPDVVSPLTWSLLEILIFPIFNSLLGSVGIEVGDHPLVGQIAGRAYFNLNTLAGGIKAIPFLRKMDLTEVLGGEQGRMEGLGQLEIEEKDLPDMRFSLLRMVYKIPGFVWWFMSHSPNKGERFLEQMSLKGKEVLGFDLGRVSDEELISKVQILIREFRSAAHGIAFSFMAMAYYTKLDKVCRKWLGDTEGTYANRLLAGMGDMDSAEAGLELWGLAAEADKDSEIKEAILAGYNWKETEKKLKGLSNNSSEEFLTSWNRFMIQHGHHARGELELSNPCWEETPSYILDVVRGYLNHIDRESPIENYKKRAKEREELTRQCRTGLKNLVKRIIFDYYLAQAQRGSLLRENIKSAFVRYWLADLRSLLLELGERLCEENAVDNRDDIFFLHLDELELVTAGKADFDVKNVIAKRKSEYEKNLKITPPKVVVGRFDPKNFAPDVVDDGQEVLEGLAVSPGIVTGKARVILRANDDEQILPGEILVAPFTDPGWTPYFLLAAAIVMDQGGLLSHGSIVAREYGIPAVVNVGPATKIIKTGQTIQVDGNRGVVKIVR